MKKFWNLVDEWMPFVLMMDGLMIMLIYMFREDDTGYIKGVVLWGIGMVIMEIRRRRDVNVDIHVKAIHTVGGVHIVEDMDGDGK